jgi:hypothetical protein
MCIQKLRKFSSRQRAPSAVGFPIHYFFYVTGAVRVQSLLGYSHFRIGFSYFEMKRLVAHFREVAINLKEILCFPNKTCKR